MLEPEQRLAMDRFLASVEKRALRMAFVHTKDLDAAFDIVQVTMMKLTQKYGFRAEQEWPPLFYRILSSKINDWHRSQKRWWQHFQPIDDTVVSETQQLDIDSPQAFYQASETVQSIERSLNRLPAKQRQTFMLRCWEGLSTKETAIAMSCTEGTVKTQYSRALQTIKNQLGVAANE